MSLQVKRRYELEFKENAVRLVTNGRYYIHVAESLGIPARTLHGWCLDRGLSNAALRRSDTSRPATGADQEVKDLRKRVRELEMEREILKKAAAFFAKELL